MSYANQRVLTIPNPRGLDKAIASIQQSLSSVSYLTKIFGRAYIFKENRNDSVVLVPKVYTGNKEYENVMVNDHYTSMCFFVATGPATPIDYVHNNQSNYYKRDIALIFWGDLKKINPSHNYVFSELIKSDLLKALSNNGYINTINKIEDDTYENVFKEFRGSEKLYEGKTQYLQYPNTGIRIDLEVKYEDGFSCGAPAANV